jgi:hypothetical protein
MRKKKSNNVEGKFQEFTFAMVLHKWFNNNKYTFNDKCEHHVLQIIMVYLDMLTIYFERPNVKL